MTRREPTPQQRLRLPAAGIALAACLSVAGCQVWALASEPFPRVVAGDTAVVVRIVTEQGEQFELESPRVVDDTIVAGWRNIGDRRDPRFDRPRVALTDVTQVEVRSVSIPRTIGFFILAGTAFYITGKYALVPIFDGKDFDPFAPPEPPPVCVVTSTCP